MMTPIHNFLIEHSPPIRPSLVDMLEEPAPVRAVGAAASEAGAVRRHGAGGGAWKPNAIDGPVDDRRRLAAPAA
jgi:hypothetical protein